MEGDVVLGDDGGTRGRDDRRHAGAVGVGLAVVGRRALVEDAVPVPVEGGVQGDLEGVGEPVPVAVVRDDLGDTGVRREIGLVGPGAAARSQRSVVGPEVVVRLAEGPVRVGDRLPARPLEGPLARSVREPDPDQVVSGGEGVPQPVVLGLAADRGQVAAPGAGLGLGVGPALGGQGVVPVPVHGGLPPQGGAEHVGRSGCTAVVVVEGRPDDGRRAVEGHRAELVARGAVARQELEELLTRGRVEQVRRSGIDAVVVVEEPPDDHDRVLDRHGKPEEVARRAVEGQELGPLLAGGRVEQVRRSGVGAVVVVPVGPDDDGRTVDGDGGAEAVPGGAVRGQELRDLLAGGRVEQVGRSRVGSVVVVVAGPDDRCRAVDVYASAEEVVLGAVGGQELGDLLTRRSVEHVRRSGSGALVVVSRRPDDDGRAVDRQDQAEVVVRGAVGG